MDNRLILVSPVEEFAVAAHRPDALDQQVEVLLCDRPLEFYAAPAHALVQRLGLGLQVDDQIGPRGLRLERFEYLLVQMQLVSFERQMREKGVLLEQEIAHRDPAEQVQLREIAQLSDPLEEEEQLRRQGEPGPVLVETRQKRVLLGMLEHEIRLQAGGEAPGEAGLADAYRAVDDDVVILGKRHRGLREFGAHHTQQDSREPWVYNLAVRKNRVFEAAR